MRKYTLKMLAFAMIFAVAPANAGQRVSPANNHPHGPACPYERAKIAAAAKAVRVAKGETKVTLAGGGGASSGHWLFGIRDTPRDLTP